jgi:hypothetical protein
MLKKQKEPPIPVTDKIQQDINALKAQAGKSILTENRVGLAILKPPKTQFKGTSIRKRVQLLRLGSSQHKELLKIGALAESVDDR